MIILIAGNKGGVGKSFIANALTHYLCYERKLKVTLIDSDTANPDVIKMHHGKGGIYSVPINLDSRQGWGHPGRYGRQASLRAQEPLPRHKQAPEADFP